VSQGWKKPSVDKRRAYVRALQSRPRPLTATELGQMLDVDASTALQMLYALERDEVVDRAPGGGKSIAWKLTGKPLAEEPSSTGIRNESPRFDAAALADALDMRAFPVLAPARILMLGERRK